MPTKPIGGSKKKQQKPNKGPTHPIFEQDWPLEYILLYIFGCSLCLLIIGYYLWMK